MSNAIAHELHDLHGVLERTYERWACQKMTDEERDLLRLEVDRGRAYLYAIERTAGTPLCRFFTAAFEDWLRGWFGEVSIETLAMRARAHERMIKGMESRLNQIRRGAKGNITRNRTAKERQKHVREMMTAYREGKLPGFTTADKLSAVYNEIQRATGYSLRKIQIIANEKN